MPGYSLNREPLDLCEFPKFADPPAKPAPPARTLYRVTHYDCASFLCRMGLIPGHIDYIEVTPRRITIADIQRVTAERFNIPRIEMTSARRARDVARPRQVAMYLATQLTPRSLPEIGRHFGNRDHTTVIHAVRQIKKLRAVDGQLDADIRAIEAVL